MKKSLIALAVLGSVAGMAQAQSSVTLYGLADIWVGSTKAEINGVGSSVTKVDGSGLATSRFGLKGSEDLGGGLKANFQLEQGFNIDTGTAGNSTGTAGSQAFDRQAWVGVSGGFGEVQVGKTWSSYDDIRSSANDNFNANVAASFNTWVGYTDRPVNSIKYISPTVGGFSGSVTYGLGEDKLANANGKSSSLTSLGLQYANGPVFVGLAYQSEKDGGQHPDQRLLRLRRGQAGGRLQPSQGHHRSWRFQGQGMERGRGSARGRQPELRFWLRPVEG